MVDGATLGEVAVDVYADTSRLEADLNKARGSAERFDRQMSSVNRSVKEAASSFSSADRSVMELARAYNPLHVAQARYINDLEKINRLQKQGVFSAQVAQDYTKRATAAYNKVVNAQRGVADGAGQAAQALGGMNTSLSALRGYGLAAGVVIGALARQVQQSLVAFMEHERAIDSFQASLAVVGNRSQAAASEIQSLGEAVAQSSLQTEKSALKAAQVLATVPNITKEALAEAVTVSAALADALGTDVAQEATKMAQVLTALADKDMKALVSATEGLNDSLRAAILTLAEGGKTADAQRVYLQGLAAAAGSGPDGATKATDELSDAWRDLKVAFGEDIAGPAAASLNWLAQKLRELQGEIANTRWSWAALFADSATLLMAGPTAAKTARGNRPFGRVPVAAPASTGPFQGGDLMGMGRLNAMIAGNARSTVKGFEARYGSGGGRGGGGRGGRGSGNSALRAQQAAEEQLLNLQRQLLGIMKNQAGTADERAGIELQMLDIDRQRFLSNLQLQVDTGRFSKAQADQIKLKYDELDAARRAVIEAERQEEAARAIADLTGAQAEDSIEILRGQQQLAKTQKRKNEIEGEILDWTFKRERSEIEAALAAKDLSDVDRKILTARKQALDVIEGQARELQRLESLNPVEAWVEAMNRSTDQIDEIYLEWQRSQLDRRVQDSAQMADDITGAFGNVARGLLSLDSPISLLRDLLTDLASIFTEEVIMRPLQDWIRMNVAGPIAERVTGFGSGPEGVAMSELKLAAGRAGLSINGLATSAASAAKALAMISGQSYIPGLSSIFSPSASLVAGVDKMIAANPAIFHDGGEIGPGGRPLRRRPGEVGITAKVGEYIMPEGPTREFRPLLDRMRAGGFSGLAGLGARGGNQRNLSVSYGDIVVNGVSDERAARRTAKQIAAEVQATIAKSSRQGIRRHD